MAAELVFLPVRRLGLSVLALVVGLGSVLVVLPSPTAAARADLAANSAGGAPVTEPGLAPHPAAQAAPYASVPSLAELSPHSATQAAPYASDYFPPYIPSQAASLPPPQAPTTAAPYPQPHTPTHQSPHAAPHPSSAEGANVSVARYGGADRYDTSLQVAEAVAADAGGVLSSVVLVSGRRWTDAVVAAPIAGSLAAPVLMTPPDQLRADALAFLQRTGVSTVMVVGPDASGGGHGPGRGVGVEVFEALEDAGIYVERVAGDSRFGTGVAAAQRVTPGAMGNRGPTAVIASSEVFADALVAGPFAARGIHPVLLTSPGELHTDVAAYLDRADVAHVVLMGGTAALSDAVEQSVADLGIEVTRVAGRSRYDTAVKAAELVEDQYGAQPNTQPIASDRQPCFGTSTIGLARARVPFDSFSAAPLLARLCAPLVLADPDEVPADTASFLDEARAAHDAVSLQVFGGDAAVSQAAIDAYLTGTDPADDADADPADDADADDSKDDTTAADDTTADATSTSTNPNVLPPGTCGGAIDDEPTQLVPSTNAEDPAWSPDCSHLVYTQDGSLWVVNNDGTGARELVGYNGGYLHSAVWSPVGDRIAYARGHNDQDGYWVSHIWTVNADGSHNNQRTEGDVVDNWPTWSPDGKHIAFQRYTSSGRDENGDRLDTDRHIVVMTSFGNKPKALNVGDSWEQTPAWSPDGTRLAYQSNGNLMVSDTDGTNARLVDIDVYFDGGLSWSPDGQRIAFVRRDGDKDALIIADIDGPRTEIVPDADQWTFSPRWSPDGQRIAFHTLDADNQHRIYVTGASGDLITGAATCRPRGPSWVHTAGFPLPNWAPSAVGTVRIGVLFMDFPDAPATHTTHEEAALGLPWVEQYLEAASYGQLDVEFVPLHRWLRAEQELTDFIGPTALSDALVSGASAHAVALADDEFDFSTVDLVTTVFPSSHFSGGTAGGTADADDVTLPTSRVNVFPLDEPRDPYKWGPVGAHEIAHNLGLLDMYPYDGSVHNRPEPSSGYEWVPVEIGLMGFTAYFLADASLMLRRVTKYHADGGSEWWASGSLAPQEMLAWSRWQLGWLDGAQVHCDSGEGATVRLAPIAQPGGGVAMAAVPLSSHEVLVVESRRVLGYDRGEEFKWSQGGYGRAPALIEEGVLVYTVDTHLGTGNLPIKVAGDSGNGEAEGFPVFGIGESVTLRGYTVTVTADDGNTHTVTITPAN